VNQSRTVPSPFASTPGAIGIVYGDIGPVSAWFLALAALGLAHIANAIHLAIVKALVSGPATLLLMFHPAVAFSALGSFVSCGSIALPLRVLNCFGQGAMRGDCLRLPTHRVVELGSKVEI
jgi:K+ transporter